MKKIALILTALLMALTVTACATTATEKDTYNIGICQLTQHPALDASTQGFIDALTEKLGEDKVKFDLQNASGDAQTSNNITNQFVSDGVDLILANGTTPLQSAAASTSTIPVFGTSVTDYATALDISDWTGATGKNISGTSDLAPLDQQAQMVKDLFPDAKKVGIIYCSGEPNSTYQFNIVKAELETLGYEVEAYTFADSNDLSAVATSAASDCDVIYTPTDNIVASSSELLQNIFSTAGIPVICGDAGTCQGCGLATLSIDYYDIGYTAGEMAYEVLKNGADISTMDVQFAPTATKQYHVGNAEALNIDMPEDYTALEQ